MNTTVETLDDNKVKISFEVDAKDVTDRIKREYKRVAKRYNFPGFRPGKAPRPVIDNMLGSDVVRTTVTEDLVNEVYPLALEENNYVPLYRPVYDYEQELVEDNKPFNFTATIQLKPQMELSSYDALEIEVPTTQASDDEVEAQMEELRNYYHDFKDAPGNTKVKPKEFVELTIKATDEKGEEVSALSAEKRLYELGSNVYPASFDAELIGMKKGEEKSFDLDMSEDGSIISNTLENKGVFHFDVKVDVIKRKILPELTDEWAVNTFGFESLDDMREKIKTSIHEQKMQAMPRRRENECLLALAARLEGDVPQGMCEVEETNLLQNFYGQLTENGITFDHYLKTMEITPEQFKEDTKKQANDLVRQDLALDAWARHADITVSDDEVFNEFAKSDLDDPEKALEDWRATGRLPMIRESIVRSKALADAIEKAQVTEVEEEKKEEKKPVKKTAKKSTKKATSKKPEEKKEEAAEAEAE